ncbi:MAG: low affinity iron permease family protein [Candidatus Binatia bacterium]
MTEPRDSLVGRVTGAFSTRRMVAGVILIWLITGTICHFSHRWFLLLSTGTSVVTLLVLFIILTGDRRKAHAISEKLNELQDHLKKDEEMLLRKLHTKHRNGDDA